jgi:hypothetical protein
MTQPLDTPNVIDVTGQLRTLEVKYRTDLAASASVSTTICHLQDYLRVRPDMSLRNCGWRCRRLGTC